MHFDLWGYLDIEKNEKNLKMIFVVVDLGVNSNILELQGQNF